MNNWTPEKKKDINQKILLFLISPFLSFLYSLRRMNTKSSFVIFFLFAVFWGLSFTINGPQIEGASMDSISFRIKFEQMLISGHFNDYLEGLKGFLSFDDGKKDYYFDTIAFFISRITDNYHLMFMTFAIVFSVFQLKSLKFFTRNENYKNSLQCLFLAFIFTFNQIFNINGMRFWTAAWFAVY